MDEKWQAMGGPRGVLGYPASDSINGLKDGGWIQIFANGAITDSTSTTTQVVYDVMWRTWKALGRESGPMGYPTSGVTRGLRDGGWIQTFQNGAITDSASTTTQGVYDVMLDASGRRTDARGVRSATRRRASNGSARRRLDPDLPERRDHRLGLDHHPGGGG